MPLDATDWAETPELQVLRRARALIERPERWMSLAQVSLMDGLPTCDQSCAEAAVRIAAVEISSKQTISVPLLHTRALNLLVAALPAPWRAVWHFNDARQTMHADVLALFDRAIARAEVAVAA